MLLLLLLLLRPRLEAVGLRAPAVPARGQLQKAVHDCVKPGWVRTSVAVVSNGLYVDEMEREEEKGA